MSMTKSFRFPDELVNQLETVAAKISRNQNWIVIQAVEEYLRKLGRSSLAEEAARQSRLVSKTGQDDEFWEHGDVSGWK